MSTFRVQEEAQLPYVRTAYSGYSEDGVGTSPVGQHANFWTEPGLVLQDTGRPQSLLGVIKQFISTLKDTATQMKEDFHLREKSTMMVCFLTDCKELLVFLPLRFAYLVFVPFQMLAYMVLFLVSCGKSGQKEEDERSQREAREPLVSGQRYERLPHQDLDSGCRRGQSSCPRTQGVLRTLKWVVKFLCCWLLLIWFSSFLSAPLNTALCATYSLSQVAHQGEQQQHLPLLLLSDVLEIGCYSHFSGAAKEEDSPEQRLQAAREFRTGYLQIASRKQKCLKSVVSQKDAWQGNKGHYYCSGNLTRSWISFMDQLHRTSPSTSRLFGAYLCTRTPSNLWSCSCSSVRVHGSTSIVVNTILPTSCTASWLVHQCKLSKNGGRRYFSALRSRWMASMELITLKHMSKIPPMGVGENWTATQTAVQKVLEGSELMVKQMSPFGKLAAFWNGCQDWNASFDLSDLAYPGFNCDVDEQCDQEVAIIPVSISGEESADELKASELLTVFDGVADFILSQDSNLSKTKPFHGHSNNLSANTTSFAGNDKHCLLNAMELEDCPNLCEGQSSTLCELYYTVSPTSTTLSMRHDEDHDAKHGGGPCLLKASKLEECSMLCPNSSSVMCELFRSDSEEELPPVRMLSEVSENKAHGSTTVKTGSTTSEAIAEHRDEDWELICNEFSDHEGTKAGSKCSKVKEYCSDKAHMTTGDAMMYKAQCYAGNSKFSVAPLWTKQTKGGHSTPGTNHTLRGIILDFGSPAVAATESYWSSVADDLATGGVKAVLVLLLLLQLTAGAGRAYALVFSQNRDTGARLTWINLASVLIASCICAMSMLSEEASPVALLGPLLSFLIVVCVGATTRQPKDEASDNKWFALVSGRHASVAATMALEAVFTFLLASCIQGKGTLKQGAAAAVSKAVCLLFCCTAGVVPPVFYAAYGVCSLLVITFVMPLEVLAYVQTEFPFLAICAGALTKSLITVCLRYHSPGFFMALYLVVLATPLVCVLASYAWLDFKSLENLLWLIGSYSHGAGYVVQLCCSDLANLYFGIRPAYDGESFTDLDVALRLESTKSMLAEANKFSNMSFLRNFWSASFAGVLYTGDTIQNNPENPHSFFNTIRRLVIGASVKNNSILFLGLCLLSSCVAFKVMRDALNGELVLDVWLGILTSLFYYRSSVEAYVDKMRKWAAESSQSKVKGAQQMKHIRSNRSVLEGERPLLDSDDEDDGIDLDLEEGLDEDDGKGLRLSSGFLAASGSDRMSKKGKTDGEMSQTLSDVAAKTHVRVSVQKSPSLLGESIGNPSPASEKELEMAKSLSEKVAQSMLVTNAVNSLIHNAQRATVHVSGAPSVSASEVDPCVARIFWTSQNTQGTLVFIAVTAAVTASEVPLKATVYVALTASHCANKNIDEYFLDRGDGAGGISLRMEPIAHDEELDVAMFLVSKNLMKKLSITAATLASKIPGNKFMASFCGFGDGLFLQSNSFTVEKNLMEGKYMVVEALAIRGTSGGAVRLVHGSNLLGEVVGLVVARYDSRTAVLIMLSSTDVESWLRYAVSTTPVPGAKNIASSAAGDAVPAYTDGVNFMCR